MKNRLMLIALLLTSLLGACKKDDGGNDAGVAITDATGAKALFSEMNILYTGTLKPALSKSPQTYTNFTLNGSSGTAVINGLYNTTNASSSTSSTSTSTIGVTVTFKDFVAGDLHINGTVRFYDYSNSRVACSTSGCASSSSTDLAYKSDDGSGNSLGQASVQFTYAEKSYKDAVVMDINRSNAAHWAIKVTNSANQTITTSY